MVIYNIQNNGPISQLVIEVINDTVYVEPTAVAYIVGNISIDADVPGVSNKFKAYYLGKKFYKPCFKGTGKIYLRSTLGTYHKFSLKDEEELVLGDNVFIACRTSIHLTPLMRPSVKNFFSGSPMINLAVKGSGNVMVLMPGPVIEHVINNDKFVAFESDIAAYSPQIKVTRELAGKGWLSIANKMVRVYRGSGSLYFSPSINKGAKRCKKT